MTDGVTPALCHLHRAKPTLSPLIPDEVDEMKILKRLTRSADPRISLRAVDLLISLKQKDEKDCERCAADAEGSHARADCLARMTDAQKAEIMALLKQVKAIQALAMTQPIGEPTDV